MKKIQVILSPTGSEGDVMNGSSDLIGLFSYLKIILVKISDGHE